MTRLVTLNGVAHDIAHHAQSGPSYLYPHLGKACSDAGLLTVDVDLVDVEPYPIGIPEREPLRLALCALRSTLVDILEKHGFGIAELESAKLEFTFPSDYGDYSLYRIRSTLISRGKRFERCL